MLVEKKFFSEKIFIKENKGFNSNYAGKSRNAPEKRVLLRNNLSLSQIYKQIGSCYCKTVISYYKTVIACNPPCQIFFILGYMKGSKNNEGYKKRHQNSSSSFRVMMVSLLPLEVLFGSPKFFNLRKNLLPYAIEISKISLLIDFEVRNSKTKLVFEKLQR